MKASAAPESLQSGVMYHHQNVENGWRRWRSCLRGSAGNGRRESSWRPMYLCVSGSISVIGIGYWLMCISVVARNLSIFGVAAWQSGMAFEMAWHPRVVPAANPISFRHQPFRLTHKPLFFRNLWR